MILTYVKSSPKGAKVAIGVDEDDWDHDELYALEHEVQHFERARRWKVAQLQHIFMSIYAGQ